MAGIRHDLDNERAKLSQAAGEACECGQFPSIYCGTTGGQVVEQDNGSSYCAIWVNRSEQ
jgi:hypothetical protein